MTEKGIPSPFMQNPEHDSFQLELKTLIKKHKIKQFFIGYANAFGIWNGSSNVVSDDMIEYIEDGVLPFLRETLDKGGDNS